MLVWFGVTASSLRFTIIHIIYPLSFIFFWGGVSCTVRHDRFGTSHCSRRSCGVIDTSFRSSCSRFSVSWAQRSSLDSAFSGIFFLLSEWTCICSWGGGVRHPRPVRESSCPTWSFLPVAWFLPDWRFPFLRLRLRSSSPWPPFVLSLGLDVSGSAEPVLVLYAPGTEHLPRCSHRITKVVEPREEIKNLPKGREIII